MLDNSTKPRISRIRSICCSQVADPLHWRSLLAPWLSRMRGFGTLNDTKIQLTVRNEKEENPAYRKSRCQVATFGDLLEFINDMENLLKICPGLLRAMTKRQPFQFELGIRSPPPSVRFIHSVSPTAYLVVGVLTRDCKASNRS